MNYRNIILVIVAVCARRLWRAGGAEGQVSCAGARIPRSRQLSKSSGGPSQCPQNRSEGCRCLFSVLRKSRRREKTGETPSRCIRSWYSWFPIIPAAIDHPGEVLPRSPSDRASRLNGRQRCWQKDPQHPQAKALKIAVLAVEGNSLTR